MLFSFMIGMHVIDLTTLSMFYFYEELYAHKGGFWFSLASFRLVSEIDTSVLMHTCTPTAVVCSIWSPAE